MYFNVSQLMKEPSGSSRVFELDEELFSADEGESQRVKGVVKLLKTDMGVWVSATLESTVPCTCSRCLRRHLQAVRMAVDEEFFAQSAPGSGIAIDRLDVPEENRVIDENHVLDFSETVRQYQALNAPMKPVCREGCKGICLDCGNDLNERPCQCLHLERDSRWGPLLDLVPSTDSVER